MRSPGFHGVLLLALGLSSLPTLAAARSVIPSSYKDCYLDPNVKTNKVYLLDENTGLPIINNASLAARQNNKNPTPSSLFFQAVSGAPKGVFDLVLDDNSTGHVVQRTLGISNAGNVIFVSKSSRGQTPRPLNGKKNPYVVTTVWSLECNGALRPRNRRRQRLQSRDLVRR